MVALKEKLDCPISLVALISHFLEEDRIAIIKEMS